jgi:hypothetical protein
MENMADIIRPVGSSLGSLSYIELCPVDEISSIPYPVNGAVISAVVFVAGKGWYSIFNAWETLQLDVKPVTSGNGMHYEININGFIPGHDYSLDYLFNQLENSKLVVKAVDMNNEVVLVCHVHPSGITGAKLVVGYDSTSSYSGKKGYAINISMLSKARPYGYTAQGSGSGS